jgi:hypothetical protein
MRVEQGYAVIRDRLEDKVTQELSVFSCAHCSRKVHASTLRSHEFSTCFNCDDGLGRGLICQSCVGRPCVPFQRKLDEMEARERLRSWI